MRAGEYEHNIRRYTQQSATCDRDPRPLHQATPFSNDDGDYYGSYAFRQDPQ